MRCPFCKTRQSIAPARPHQLWRHHGTKRIADLAALYRIPISLHNVSGLILNMASQQFSAAIFNCPLMECSACRSISMGKPQPHRHQRRQDENLRAPGLGVSWIRTISRRTEQKASRGGIENREMGWWGDGEIFSPTHPPSPQNRTTNL